MNRYLITRYNDLSGKWVPCQYLPDFESALLAVNIYKILGYHPIIVDLNNTNPETGRIKKITVKRDPNDLIWYFYCPECFAIQSGPDYPGVMDKVNWHIEDRHHENADQIQNR